MPASVILQPQREKSLRRLHPWVFASAIDSLKGRCRPGDTVDVFSSTGEWLARGAWSPASQIRVRIWTFDKSEVIDNGFFVRRIQSALRLRQKWVIDKNTNSYRLIASESDGLPGVTVDVYNDVTVIQLLSAGADKQRDKILWALQKILPGNAIYERSDVDVRAKEGLEPLVAVRAGDMPDEVQILENGMRINVDVEKGHKTGFYLDQRDSRDAVRRYASKADVLNCFSYTGTFACAALRGGAKHVTNVDVSDNALSLASSHLKINGFNPNQAEMVNKDVFDALREYHTAHRQFDIVILDPPKFVDSKASLNRAARGYKDINMYGIHAVKSGGLLFTFSCSGLMPADLFQKIVADAALDAGRTIKIVERLTQAKDHPVIGTFPEGYYLKGLICEVSDL